MTYKDAFVVEVKCKGKILRMKDDFVYLPFGEEYSLYLKNLSPRRASVKIHIDGQDVLDYQSLILEPNSSTELEGFLSGIVAKNKFKFIKKTKQIQEFRGDKIDDGIIRVEFAYEKDLPITKVLIEDHHHYHHYPKWNYNDWFFGDSNIRYSNSVRGMSNQSQTINNSNDEASASQIFYSSNVTMDSLGIESLGQPLNDEGITVKGSEINQSFRYGSIGELKQSEIIIIRMKGITDISNSPIKTPLTVKSKMTCKTCGKKSKSSFKYCPNCGTYLE